MRVIAFVTLFLISITSYSQNSLEKHLDSTVSHLKAQTEVDKNDPAAFSILEAFYNEALQSDKGELSQQTVQRIHAFMGSNNAKNKHLLILFLMYQEHISQTAAQGKTPNVDYQLACIQRLESETQSVYQKVPTIIYIYKAEALQSTGQSGEAKALVAASFKKVPNSIPLKVYRYLDSKDESIKNDLLQNHSTHWMVQQFGIK